MPTTSFVVKRKNNPVPHTIIEEKNELAIKVLSLTDKALVHTLKLIFEDLTTVKKVSRAQYNREIKAAVKRVKRGKFISNEDVMKEMEGW